MKTVSIEELHEQTGRVVREAAAEEIVVTENGQPVAVVRGVTRQRTIADIAGRYAPQAMDDLKLHDRAFVEAIRESEDGGR